MAAQIQPNGVIWKPALAYRIKELSQLRFPLLCTPKFDGIRCVIQGGYALTRSFRLVPNDHIRRHLEILPDGTDGEIMAGSFSETQSAVMRKHGEPDFRFFAFDFATDLSVPYERRAESLTKFTNFQYPWVEIVLPTPVANLDEFLEFEEKCLAAGYEGVVSRAPGSPYKCGRSTRSEAYMCKWKRVQDSEAVALSFKEERENQNDIVPDLWGYARRPGGGSERVGKGTMGGVEARDVHTGVVFGCGSGFSAAERQHVWDNQAAYIGCTFTYSYQDVGVLEKPRFPRFKGWRYD
jgi:DNA ligase-1